MLICGNLLVGSKQNGKLCTFLFFFLWLGISNHYAQGTLKEFADKRAQLFRSEQEYFRSHVIQGVDGAEFSRYSPLGVPLFLAPLNLSSARATTTSLLSDAMLGVLLQGSGMQMAAWDDGLVAPHIELGGRVVATEGTQLKTHATHVAGTLIAAGVNANARGMAPRAELLAFRFDNDEAEMAALAAVAENPLLISNHSYGTVAGWTSAGGAWRWVGNPAVSATEDYNFGLYTAKAQLLDEIASQAPFYTICWAAGNDRGEPGDGSRPPDCNGGTGFDCIIPDAVAKNIITVGAIDPLAAYTSPASVTMSGYSSWGPTDDGRIKPDLVGVGTDVFSLSAAGANAYTVLSGTSMATPNVSGSLLLLQELHKKLEGRKPMRAATLKALAIHTAKEAGEFAGPDYRFGWGLLDAQAAAQVLVQRDGANVIVQENTLRTGETWTLNLNPQTGRKITVTAAWTDAPAAPAPDQLDPPNLALVNDLDVRLVDDQGTTHFPWILNPANPADRATRGDNFRDNVEKIEFDLPAARPYQIRVSSKGALKQGKQDFSIIVTYTATSSGRTLYWIGDGGNWNDATKWSFSSGGPAAFTVPTSNDRVIVDENSFQQEDTNVIQLTSPVSIRSLIWLTSEPAGIEFNAMPLTVSTELKVASAGFRSQDGAIHLSSSANAVRSADFFNLNAPALQLRVLAGHWRIRGAARLRAFETNAHRLELDECDLQIESWLASVTQAAQWSFARSRIRVAKELRFVNASRISSIAFETHLAFKGDAQWEASELNWPIATRLDSGRLTLAGNGNYFRSFQSHGRLVVTGSNRFDRMEIGSGLAVFPANSRQQVARLAMSNGVGLEGATGATIELTKAEKFCFNELRISNVALTGLAAVSVGTISTLVNAPGWQPSSCANILFADFNLKFPCAGGNTTFVSSSSGNPDNLAWTFQQGSQSGAASGLAPAFQFQSAGTARVRLTASRGGGAHTRDSVFQIQMNSLAENEIMATSDRLASFLPAERFEWYRDQKKLDGQTERFIAHNGAPGAYQVLAYQDECNRWSPVYTITGVAEAKPAVTLYPNPVTERIFVDTNEPIDEFVIYDQTGRRVKSSRAPSADVHDLPPGLYFCDVRTQSGRTRLKFVLQR